MSATQVADTPQLQDEGEHKRRWPKVLLALVLLLGLAGGAAWYLLLSDGAEAAQEEPRDGEVVELEPLTTTTGESTMRHARVGVGVVLVEGAAPEEIDSRTALLEDELLQEVSEMSADQLRSDEGSRQLREHLSSVAIDIWGAESVRRVVLTELLVQ